MECAVEIQYPPQVRQLSTRCEPDLMLLVGGIGMLVHSQVVAQFSDVIMSAINDTAVDKYVVIGNNSNNRVRVLDLRNLFPTTEAVRNVELLLCQMYQAKGIGNDWEGIWDAAEALSCWLIKDKVSRHILRNAQLLRDELVFLEAVRPVGMNARISDDKLTDIFVRMDRIMNGLKHTNTEWNMNAELNALRFIFRTIVMNRPVSNETVTAIDDVLARNAHLRQSILYM